MIRLVATDMDGTLLNSQHQIPPDYLGLVRERQDVVFVIASGRQYYNLAELFGEVLDRLYFIAENGGLVFFQGETLYRSALPNKQVRRILARVAEIEGAHPILCGEHSAYLLKNDAQALEGATQYYARRQSVRDFEEVIGSDAIVKVAVYSHLHAQDLVLEPLATLQAEQKQLKAVLSGRSWVDVMPTDVNKGVALAALQKKLGIAPEDCAAFGDYLNDIELLSVCGESYAMANAHPVLLQQARHIAPSHDDDGVMRVLRNIL